MEPPGAEGSRNVRNGLVWYRVPDADQSPWPGTLQRHTRRRGYHMRGCTKIIEFSLHRHLEKVQALQGERNVQNGRAYSPRMIRSFSVCPKGSLVGLVLRGIVFLFFVGVAVP